MAFADRDACRTCAGFKAFGDTVNQLIEAGQLTEDEAEAFEHSNIILQALGTTEQVAVDLGDALGVRVDDVAPDECAPVVLRGQVAHVASVDLTQARHHDGNGVQGLGPARVQRRAHAVPLLGLHVDEEDARRVGRQRGAQRVRQNAM